MHVKSCVGSISICTFVGSNSGTLNAAKGFFVDLDGRSGISRGGVSPASSYVYRLDVFSGVRIRGSVLLWLAIEVQG